jgi:hypothetical protein
MKKYLFLFFFLGLASQFQAQTTGKFGGGDAAGYARAQFNSGLALYVELADFTANAEQDGVLLQWLTEREWHNSHFEVEHSADGRNFATIGWIDGAGNQQEKSSYAFKDYAPEEGRNYYRIKDVDWNGKSHFSELKEVFFTSGNEFGVFPNPTAGSISVHLPQQAQYKPISLKVLSYTGQEVWNQTYMGISSNEIGPLKLPASLSGLYIVQLSSSSKSWSQLLRVN